jgi:hypothetical protein
MAPTQFSTNLVDEVGAIHRAHVTHEMKAVWYFLRDLEEAEVPEWFIRQTLAALTRQTGGSLEAYGMNYLKKVVTEAWKDRAPQTTNPTGVNIV